MKKSQADQILAETVSYLTGVSSSSYTPFVAAIPADLGWGQQPVSTADIALLPMTIATADASAEKRVEFTMLINPETMNHGKTNTIHTAITRKGFVTQLWGPNQDLLTGTGKSAAFMISSGGLTSFSRRRTLGFQNFMAFLRAYRNNGYMIIDPINLLDKVTSVISLVHGIEVSFDGQTFMGHFNNFTIDENAESPFTFNYNFEFVCSTLSEDYSQVRGHFKKIPRGSYPVISPEPVLLSDILQKPVDRSFFGNVWDYMTEP